MVELYHKFGNKRVVSYIPLIYYSSRNAIPPILVFFYQTLQIRALTKKS